MHDIDKNGVLVSRNMKSVFLVLASTLLMGCIVGTKSYEEDHFRHPSDCKPGFCYYEAEWAYDNISDFVTFIISANVERGYSADIGFADEKFGHLVDLVTGYLKKDRYHFLLDDRHTDYLKPHKTIVDEQQDAVLISHSYKNGTLVYTFKRKRFTGDIFDKSLRKCVYFKFTWTENISSKKEKKVFFSKNKVCIGPMPPAGPCKKMYCKVNSHCIHNGINARCICNSGYHMVNGHCKTPYAKDPCLDIYCKQHEYCMKSHGKARCECKPDHKCQDEIRDDHAGG